MKNKLKVISIALVAVFIFSGVNCFGQSGSRTLNNAEDLKKYLDSQPANSPDKPIRVSMTINEPMLKSVVDVIKKADKYVSLNITGDALKTIGQLAFDRCTNLISVTIPNIRKTARFT